MTTSFNNQAIAEIFRKYRILKTQVSKLFGQTNNATVERWINGKDIYVNALAKLCSSYNIDLLSFFTHDNKPFSTTLQDIAVMEENGLNLRDLLKEHNIEPSSNKNIRTLASDINGVATDNAKPIAQTISADAPERPAEEHTILSENIIDRFITFQTRAYTHEQEALERQRRDMQAIIDRQDAAIAELKKELRKQKQPLPYSFNNSRTIVVNDDTEINEN